MGHTPDGVGQREARSWLDKGIKVIDYSGDFRFNDPETYSGYAARIGKPQQHASPDLLPRSVYGLAELHRKEIARSDLVGNPGCFAVSCILGLSPALKSGLIETDSIICDAKTGVSGAGKTPSPTFHYPARYDAMNAYRVSGHQHVYEIERECTLVAGRDIRVTFTPHVIPLCRGILTTIYGRLKDGAAIRSIEEAYRSSYAKDGFVRVYGPGKALTTADVRGSNFCNLSLNVDERTGRLIVISMIDNILRPLLIEGKIRMHTMIVFFSIMGGIAYFGLLGMVFGPIIVALGLTLLEVYKIEARTSLRPIVHPSGEE